MLYMDHTSLKYIFTHKDLNMRQRRKSAYLQTDTLIIPKEIHQELNQIGSS